MKKNLFAAFFAGVLLTVTTGCATNADAVYAAEKEQNLALARAKVCEELLEAFKQNDYKRMIRFMVPELVNQYPENVFNQARGDMLKTLGEMDKYEFITELKAPIFKNMIYRVSFKRSASDKSVIEQEVLFRVLLVEDKGRVRAMSFVFF